MHFDQAVYGQFSFRLPLIINGLVEGFMTKLQELFPYLAVIVIYIINLIFTLAITALLFAIIFKVLPDALIR